MSNHEWVRAAMMEILGIDIDNPDDSDEPGYSLPQNEQYDVLLKRELLDRFKKLSDSEQEILVYRFGLASGKPQSEAETAELYNIDGKEVRQIEFKAFGHRQRGINAEKLREHFNELRRKKEIKNGWKYQW